MFVDFHITVDEKKAKHVLAILKELEFVRVETDSLKTAKKSRKTKRKLPADKDFPYFGMCPDWDMDVKELRKSDSVKRLEGWL